jgi:chaperone modulatory protein CbpM
MSKQKAALYRLEKIIDETGFTQKEIFTLIEKEIIRPFKNQDEPEFDEENRRRIRLVCELKRDFGVNDSGIDIILHLLDQIYGMRNELFDFKKFRERGNKDEI